MHIEEGNEFQEPLTGEQIDILTEYTKALKLLFDCLELAKVTDRERIQIAAAGGGVI